MSDWQPITVRRLDSGYYHICGRGPCNWAQPPEWPCSEEVLRKHAFPEASDEFIRAALRLPESAIATGVRHGRRYCEMCDKWWAGRLDCPRCGAPTLREAAR
jgi:hypothetical protein